MKLESLGVCLLVACAAAGCAEEMRAPGEEVAPAVVRATRQGARSDYNKVLILGSSVNGGINSPEAQAVLAYRPSAQITVVTPEQWAAMSVNEFSRYHLIIIGDPGCVTGTAPFQAAIENRDVWGPVVDSELVIVGTNTNAGGSQPLMQVGIHQALDNGVQLYTSMYISLGCAYQNAPANTPVEVLEPFGNFKVRGLSTCADSGHRFVTFPSQLFSDQLFDMALTGADGCATRTVFTEYPVRNLTATVLATDISGSNPIPGGQSYQDYDEGLVYDGTPYVFVRNVSAVGTGCGGDSMNIPSGEECDLGDGFNGQRSDVCSFSCRLDWCGNGVLDAGEECDNGSGNQRDPHGDIINGNCSAFCKVINVPPGSLPPVALCRNVTETVTNQCGMNADINNGSYGPGGEAVTCTQNPAGPYNIGNTTVTLTCEDASGRQASCTGVVTIIDRVKPVVTIAGLNPQPVECNRNGVYTSGFEPNPAATANDMCSGAVPVTKSGTVTVGAIGTYQRIYTATDAAGNVGTATRTVNVSDTLKPVVTTPTTVAPLECKMSTYTDVAPTANDQCAISVPVTTAGAVNVNAVGNYVLTYTARDPAGNVSDPKTRSVVVRDTRAPSVTTNGPTSVAVECNDPTFADPGAMGSDVCAGTVPATPIQAVTVDTPGTYTVSYQAVDPSGNIGVSNNSRTFVVSDTLPPVLTMNGAASIPLECANPFTDPGATANDQCAGNVAVTTTGSVNNRVLGAQTLTYSANDGRGHTATRQRTVTVSDTQAPVITITGSLTPPPVECGSAYLDPGATANDACAGTVAAVAEPPVSPNVPGNYNVHYRATDPSGNTTLSTASRAVTVQDTLAPVLTLNGLATMGLECATNYTEQGATANDQCAGNLNVTISGTVDNRQLSTQTVTYSANDGHGHTATKTRAVTVSDTLAPAITLNGPLNMPVECGDRTYADPGATANDACAGALPAVPEPTANPNVPGNYVVRYRATDPSGNSALSSTSRTVSVSDTLPPTLQLAGANPQQVECGTAWADPGSAASDQCAGVLTPTVSGGVNHQVPADYPITYTVSDGSGHTVTANRAVNVRDTLPPSITVNGPANDAYACGATYTDPGASATDACDTNVQVIATQTGNTTTPGTFTITYKARDAAGHEVTSPVQRTVTVTDDVPPTLVLLGNASPVLECPTPFNDQGATANDACYGDVSNRIQVSGSVTAGTPGTYPVTYTVSDPSGQSAPAVTRTVTVQDTQRPQVTVNGPLDIPVECGSGTFTDPGASASDACAGALAAVPSTTANPGAPGTYTISYTATDPSGNVGTSNTNRTVRVIDSIAPQIALTGGNMTLECASPWNDPGATASDQCAGNLAVTASGSVNNRQLGPQSITYTADDGTKRATVSRTVTVNDTLPPTLALNGPANDTFACGDNYIDPGATATDACDPNVTVTATQTGNPGQPGTFTITYSARDASNNVVASPVTRTVTVGDDAPPTLALLGSTTPSLECGTAFNDPGATANDACFGDVTDRIQVAGTVNSGTPGSYPLTYTVTDPSGQSATPATRTVSVQDTLAPSITVLGSLNQQLQCDHAPYADPGATATDACAGNLTSAIQRIGDVNTGAAGSYTLSYRVTDPSGNTATSGDVRTVTVVDNLPPTITLNELNQNVECGSDYVDPGATALDECEGNLDARIRSDGEVNPLAVGDYDVTYSVADSSGNEATPVARTVKVVDTIAPNIECPEPIVVHIQEGSEADVTPGTATATDTCDLDPVSIPGPTQTRFPLGETTVTYTATDAAGNTTSCTSTITVVPVPVEDLDRALLGGAGCSSASGGPSTLGWMGMGALAVLLASRRKRSRLPVLAVLLLGSRAFAQLDGVPSFEMELLKLNPSATGSLVLGTGELLQGGDYRLSLTTHYENDPLVLFHNGKQVGVLVQHRATAHLAAAYGAWGWLELGAQVPVLLLQRGEDLSAHGLGQPEKGPALGTPLLTLRVKLLAQREEMPVGLALGVHVGPAVGSGLALAREPRALPSLMVGRQFSRLRAALDAGILLRPRTILSPDKHIQDELGHALRLGGTLSTLGSGLRGELALTGSVPLYREGAFIEALAGARLPVSASVEAYAMAGVAAGTAPGTPDFRLLLGVAYGRTQPPRAETRIPEPVVPPPPPEGDGVEEAVDPVKDSDSDAPPLPSEGEGVEEAVDPVKDSDSDGILDAEDACPLEPGIPEMHGCPAQDRDQDTVLDLLDNCPDAAGPPANQGCPEEEKQLVAIQKDRIEIRDTVHFNFDKATIQRRSFPLLNQVARILVEHPEILSVSIEGHTDSQGSAAYNRDLSRRRAESVRNYLAQKGVARSRMEARGFGEDRPVQTNATEAGRAANRRVDFMTRYTPSAP